MLYDREFMTNLFFVFVALGSAMSSSHKMERRAFRAFVVEECGVSFTNLCRNASKDENKTLSGGTFCVYTRIKGVLISENQMFLMMLVFSSLFGGCLLIILPYVPRFIVLSMVVTSLFLKDPSSGQALRLGLGFTAASAFSKMDCNDKWGMGKRSVSGSTSGWIMKPSNITQPIKFLLMIWTPESLTFSFFLAENGIGLNSKLP